MSRTDALTGEMQRILRLIERNPLQLDDGTAERLLDGTMAPDDAPPAYQRVSQLLALASSRVTHLDTAREAEAVASISARVTGETDSAPQRSTVNTKRRFPQIVAASVVGATVLFGGLAAAGALPDAAQGVAADMFDAVGVTVPNPDGTAGSHPNGRGQSDAHPVDASASDGQGSSISDLARNTTATGVDKGGVISGVASDDRSQAGQHGDADANTSVSTPPVTAPNSGTPTANTASNGQSTIGTGLAATDSDGHSVEGSTNDTIGMSHTP